MHKIRYFGNRLGKDYLTISWKQVHMPKRCFHRRRGQKFKLQYHLHQEIDKLKNGSVELFRKLLKENEDEICNSIQKGGYGALLQESVYYFERRFDVEIDVKTILLLLRYLKNGGDRESIKSILEWKGHLFGKKDYKPLLELFFDDEDYIPVILQGLPSDEQIYSDLIDVAIEKKDSKLALAIYKQVRIYSSECKGKKLPSDLNQLENIEKNAEQNLLDEIRRIKHFLDSPQPMVSEHAMRVGEFGIKLLDLPKYFEIHPFDHLKELSDVELWMLVLMNPQKYSAMAFKTPISEFVHSIEKNHFRVSIPFLVTNAPNLHLKRNTSKELLKNLDKWKRKMSTLPEVEASTFHHSDYGVFCTSYATLQYPSEGNGLNSINSLEDVSWIVTPQDFSGKPFIYQREFSLSLDQFLEIVELKSINGVAICGTSPYSSFIFKCIIYHNSHQLSELLFRYPEDLKDETWQPVIGDDYNVSIPWTKFMLDKGYLQYQNPKYGIPKMEFLMEQWHCNEKKRSKEDELYIQNIPKEPETLSSVFSAASEATQLSPLHSENLNYLKDTLGKVSMFSSNVLRFVRMKSNEQTPR